MTIEDNDRLAVLGGFLKVPPDAPTGSDHSAFRLTHALARTGRWKAIDVYQDRDRQPDVILPKNVACRLLERPQLIGSEHLYSAIYVAGEQKRYPPHLLRADHSRAPVVCEIGTAHEPNQWTNLYWCARSGAIRPSDGFIFKSPAAESLFRQVWERWQDRDGRLVFPSATVIPNGVDLASNRRNDELRTQTRRHLGLGDASVVFLTFSRLSPGTKGDYRALLFLWKRLVEQEPEAVLLLSGKATDRAFLLHLRACAREAGLGNHLLMAEDPYDVWSEARERLMSAADVFLHMSTGVEETASNSTLEAMAFGLPIIASHWGGFPELVENGGNGFLIPTLVSEPPPSLQRIMLARTPADTNSALGRCVGCDGDAFVRAAAALCASDTRAEMGRQSRIRAETAFDLEEVARRRVSFLDALGKQARDDRGPPVPVGPDLVDFRTLLWTMGTRPLSGNDMLSISHPDGFAFARGAPSFAHDLASLAAIELALRQSAPLAVDELVQQVRPLLTSHAGEKQSADAIWRACTRIIVGLIAYGVVSVVESAVVSRGASQRSPRPSVNPA